MDKDMTIDAETRSEINNVGMRVDEAIRRFERSYKTIIDNNKDVNHKLDEIIGNQADQKTEIEILKERRSRDRDDILLVKDNCEFLQKKVDKMPRFIGGMIVVGGVVMGLMSAIGDSIKNVFK